MARAAEQAGIIDGHNPSKFDPKNPVVLFIIQCSIIIIFTRLLGYPLAKIRQPKVIAEVIGGVLLGPSVLGRVPGFSAAIFPPASMPVLNMAANLGLILYLFLIGLEVDLRLMIQNWRIALSVGLAGMLLPFGLGVAIAVGLFHQFREEEGVQQIEFGTYALFVGVAMAITAFPVLCRILTELKLLGTQVGLVVLSAGVGNDVVGWILLALAVALVNAGSGLTALWVLLTCVGFIGFLVVLVRPAFIWILKRNGSIQDGPSQSIVALTILLVLASSFFTAIIGVHAIFGGFLVGLICPHEGGFAIKLAEKVEDLVTVLFLPLYFALSGLSTNIGLLDSGITWGYVFGVIAVAFAGKMIGGTLAARFNRMVWRESFTIGTLMSCKGLVELIVLNIGLQAKILSVRTFTIFVVMALVTTFATTPLVSFLYPPAYQKKLAAWKRGEIDWDTGKPLNPNESPDDQDSANDGGKPGHEIRKLLIALRLDSLPSIFTFIDLLGGEKTTSSATKVHPSLEGKTEAPELDQGDGRILHKRPLEVRGLRMFELTERLSSVMQESEVDEYSARDPVVNAFHTFGQLHNVAVSGTIRLAPEYSYADVLAESATEARSDMILLPWSDTGSVSEIVNNPNPNISPSEAPKQPYSHPSYNAFVEKVLNISPCATAVFVNNGFGATKRDEHKTLPLTRSMSIMSFRSMTDAVPTAPLADRSHHIFFPYFGGRDDHAALRFVLKLAMNPNVTATIIHVDVKAGKNVYDSAATSVNEEREKSEGVGAGAGDAPAAAAGDAAARPTTATTPTATNGEGEGSAVTDAEQDATVFATTRQAVPDDMKSRLLFKSVPGGTDVVEAAREEVGSSGRKNAGDLVVLGRRVNVAYEIEDGNEKEKGKERERHEVGGGIRATLGATAAAVLEGGVRGSVLVIQAGKVR